MARGITAGLIVIMCAGFAAAQEWTAVVLHPPGAEASGINGTDVGVQAGWMQIGGLRRACCWSGTPESVVDLHPIGASESEATGISVLFEGQQVGWVVTGGQQQAVQWRWTAASVTSFHPPGAVASLIENATGPRQIGAVAPAGVFRAAFWNGSPSTLTVLHPTESYAYGGMPNDQFGVTIEGGLRRAARWRGVPGTHQSLHPAGAVESATFSGNGVFAFGAVWVQNGAGSPTPRATRWRIFPSLAVEDLHPSWAEESLLRAEAGDHRVGYVGHTGGARRAAVWMGASNSALDLHEFLPGGGTAFVSSEATSASITQGFAASQRRRHMRWWRCSGRAWSRPATRTAISAFSRPF